MRSILLQTVFCKGQILRTSTFLLWNLNIILESLPISSSGHIKLVQNIFSLENKFNSHTEHLMHIPNALIISIFLAWKARCTLVTPSVSWLALIIMTALIANTITGLTYLFAKKHMPALPLSLGFFISGSLLLSLYYVPNGTIVHLTLFHALVIGCAQTLALLPGISRMALTVTAAIWLGIDPNLSFIISLTCELLLILVAVGSALLASKPFEKLWPLSAKQLIMLTLSTIVSYKALEVAQYGFVTDLAIYFGWYLVILSVYSMLTKPLKID